MLIESGDLIPVRRDAIEVPWTKRKAQIMAFLFKGPVNFQVSPNVSILSEWTYVRKRALASALLCFSASGFFYPLFKLYFFIIFYRPTYTTQMLATLPRCRLTSIHRNGQKRIWMTGLQRRQHWRKSQPPRQILRWASNQCFWPPPEPKFRETCGFYRNFVKREQNLESVLCERFVYI